MTNEELQGHIDAIRSAVLDGSLQESNEKGGWGEVSGTVVAIAGGSYQPYKYRIKPKEPREVWINPACIGHHIYPQEIHYKEIPGWPKFREVLE